MQEPGTRIVCYPSYDHVLIIATSVDHVAANGIYIIEGRIVCAFHNVKGMLVTMSTSQTRYEAHDSLPHEDEWDADIIYKSATLSTVIDK